MSWASSNEVLESLQRLRLPVFADLLQGFCLDLPDALARDAERAAPPLQACAKAVLQPEPHLQNLLFALAQVDHDFFDKVAKHRARGQLRRRGFFSSWIKSDKRGILFIADRRLDGQHFLRNLLDVPHLIHIDTHLGGDLFS